MQQKPDWTHRGTYIATRSSRRAGDTDIEPGWADEAVTDPRVLIYTPDPKSKSGQTQRAIGFSESAGFVVTVILLPTEEAAIGVNAWKSNTQDTANYENQEPS